MVHWRFPYQIDGNGRTATTGDAAYIRGLIEMVIFTAPGERVNRPDFGSGLNQLVFGGNSDELATATQFLVSGALQSWLGDLIRVDDVIVSSEEATLAVTIRYAILSTGERQEASFTRKALP